MKRIATERHIQTRLNETRPPARPGGSHRACRRFAVIDGEYTGGVADRQQDAQEPPRMWTDRCPSLPTGPVSAAGIVMETLTRIIRERLRHPHPRPLPSRERGRLFNPLSPPRERDRVRGPFRPNEATSC